MNLLVEFHQSLSTIDASAWNALGEADYPFTRYEFLKALEENHCLLEFGWQPVYILLKESGELNAALPCYIKNNSYGELVFDHSWANAYQQSGRHYYPKLVTAVPYTPATGPRFLIHRNIGDPDQRQQMRLELVKVAKQFCTANDLSGWHCLFERESTIHALDQARLLFRYDCQYHWHNQHYRSFDDFLARLSSRKRKNIRKERASVQSEGLQIVRKHGDEMDAREWQRVHDLYAGIFLRKYGTPTLTPGFFRAIGKELGQRVFTVLALRNDEIVAASLFLVSDSTLFGRVWGCDEYYNYLHFECCYYQGIDYCIENGLQVFDPGAQGEHKISRGFLPTRTCSAHWLADTDFHTLIQKHLALEEQAINDYCQELARKSPYRQEQPA